MHAAPSADLTELLCTVQNTGRADSGTTDRVNITADRKLELPKAKCRRTSSTSPTTVKPPATTRASKRWR